MEIKDLERIIATNNDPVTVKKAEEQLAKLQTQGANQIQLAQVLPSANIDPQVAALIAALNAAASSGGGAGSGDIRAEVLRELALRKINFDDLSDSLKAQLNSTRQVQLTINQMGVTSKVLLEDDRFLKQPLTQLILSDLAAKNNVYLYGGAGTGKTYTAGGIAKLMDWATITLNCNQYTSPLEIIGGQTIDGYQEGKLIMAWSNTLVGDNDVKTKVKGVVLILDELPKIDPNTAGILNDALAKIKQFKPDDKGQLQKPIIANGKNQEFELGNLFVIATGNVALNTIDPDYEANFKQDLSLQDRFIGSTYKVFINYEQEFNVIMKGLAFIWIFGTKLREAIEDPSIRASSQAFVSIRFMENLKSTYIIYRDYTAQKGVTKNVSIAITNPKTLIDAIDSFLLLIKPAQRQMIADKVDYKGFKKIVEEKNTKPFDINKIDFDTPDEIDIAKAMIKVSKAKQKAEVSI